MIRYFEKEFRYLTSPEFTRLNRKAIRNNFTRQVDTKLTKLLGKETKYPIPMIMYHAGDIVRCQVLLDQEGDHVWIDMKTKDYEDLPVFKL